MSPVKKDAPEEGGATFVSRVVPEEGALFVHDSAVGMSTRTSQRLAELPAKIYYGWRVC